MSIQDYFDEDAEFANVEEFEDEACEALDAFLTTLTKQSGKVRYDPYKDPNQLRIE